MSIARLMSEHDRIDIAIQQLASVTGQDQPEAINAVVALSELAAELSYHLAHEDSYIYAAAALKDGTRFAKTANEFVTEFAALRADWDVYLREWTTDCIEGDWGNFCQETRSILGRLSDRVRAESEVLYAIGLQQGVIPLNSPICQAAA